MTDDPRNLVNPYRLAAALIKQDLARLPALYLLLVLPHLAGMLGIEVPTMALLFFERACQLIFLSFITLSWIERFTHGAFKIAPRSVAVFFLVGFLVWISLMTPLFTMLVPGLPETYRSLAVFIVVPAIFLVFRYFFYFFPILNGITAPVSFMQSALTIVRGESYLVIKSAAAALGWFSLLSAATLAFSPDGRSLTVNYLLTLISGVFWFIHCYVSLAISLIYCGEKDWYDYGLDPYRKGRLTGLTLSAPAWLSHLLQPRQGLIALTISLLVWFANMISLETGKPAPEIKVVRTEIVSDNSVLLVLELIDEEYRFRGFQPVNFALAGEKRAPVSEVLESAAVIGTEGDMRFGLPSTASSVNLELKFKTARKAETLRLLEDLYLWYRGYKVAKIDGSSISPLPQK